MSDAKVCHACGKEFVRRANESPSRFAGRVVCSRSCAGLRKHREAALPVPDKRTCAACGGTFTRKTTESRAYFMERVVCSTSCANVVARSKRKQMKVERERPKLKPVMVPPSVSPGLVAREIFRRAMLPALWLFEDQSGVLSHEVPY